MAYQEQFTCDVCGTVRQPSNNWFIGRGIGDHSVSLTILPFNSAAAKECSNLPWPQVILCGQSCVFKWVSQNVESLHPAKPAAPQVTLVVGTLNISEAGDIETVEQVTLAVEMCSNCGNSIHLCICNAPQPYGV